MTTSTCKRPRQPKRPMTPTERVLKPDLRLGSLSDPRTLLEYEQLMRDLEAHCKSPLIS
jgi:hypothetical protein